MLQRKKEKTVYFGTECNLHLAPKICELLPWPLKNEICLNSFKPKIKSWVTNKCARQLRKKYLGNVDLIKGALSDLRQFLAIENPLKMIKNAFYFTSKALFVLKIFDFLS